MVAPWLIPTDVIRSASAGANVGLQARAADLRAAVQRQAAAEFAAKLNQQAYQFSAEQDAAAARLAIAQDQHAARLATELRQQDALDAYRQGELKVRQQQADTNAARLLRTNFEPRVVDVGGKALWQVEPNRYMFPPHEAAPASVTPKAATLTPAEKIDADIASRDLTQAYGALRAARTSTDTNTLAVATQGVESAKNLLRSSSVPYVSPSQGMGNLLEREVALPAAPDKVIVVKDGKRFYLPKSQLDEALREGYKLWQ